MADETESGGVSDSPKKGPTLSTSTSSFEALDPHDPNLSRLATTMFQKTADYLFGELTATQGLFKLKKLPQCHSSLMAEQIRSLDLRGEAVEDYKLLESMNQATIAKYSDMKQISSNISRTMTDLNEKYTSLQPYLDQIDQIEDSVNKLEQAAYKLDAYSKRLEAKFKSLEKR